MFVLFLVVALITGAALLALNARERVESLVLIDRADAVALEGWAILVQHSVVAGILATVTFLLALAIGLSASELHIRLALRRRRERLDRTYRYDELDLACADRQRLEEELAATRRKLVAVKGQRGDFRRRLRQVTRERDRALKAGAKASRVPRPAQFRAVRRRLAANCTAESRHPASRGHGRNTVAKRAARPRRCGTDLKASSPQRRGWACAKPRSISRAAFWRTGLPTSSSCL